MEGWERSPAELDMVARPYAHFHSGTSAIPSDGIPIDVVLELVAVFKRCSDRHRMMSRVVSLGPHIGLVNTWLRVLMHAVTGADWSLFPVHNSPQLSV